MSNATQTWWDLRDAWAAAIREHGHGSVESEAARVAFAQYDDERRGA